MANETINQIVSEDDDAFERDDTGDFTGFCAIGKNIIAGEGVEEGALRFQGLAIGQGVSIDFCNLYYKYSSVGAAGSGTWRFRVFGIKEANTASFGSSNPIGRPQTTASLTISEGRPTAGGTKILNVITLVQEVVNQGSWASGNALGIVLTDNGTDDQVGAYADLEESFLAYRLSPEPNFTPTPQTINAASLPVPQDIGFRIARPGKSALTADEQDLFLNSKKKQIKVLKEGHFVASAASDKAIVHGLGYVPFVTVYGKDSGVWSKLGGIGFTFSDAKTYFIDKYNLYLHAADAGDEFYYRIFLDKLNT